MRNHSRHKTFENLRFVTFHKSPNFFQHSISTTAMAAARHAALNEELEGVLDLKIEQLLASAGARMQGHVVKLGEIPR